MSPETLLRWAADHEEMARLGVNVKEHELLARACREIAALWDVPDEEIARPVRSVGVCAGAGS